MLSGKVALVTGASRGIGKEIALTLAKNGATVIVNYNGSKERACEVVNTIKENGGNAVAMQCNVADFSEGEAMVSEILKEFGKVDILVNNAGITKDNLIMRMSEADFDAVLDTNLKGTFNMVRHLSKQFMKLKYGKIINISSVSGVMGNPGQANYSASKAGVIGLTKSVARELATRNICVNAIAPGFISTEMTEVLSDNAKESLLKMIPMQRLGQPSDIANMVLFLAGNQSDYITGQVFSVDGGMAI